MNKEIKIEQDVTDFALDLFHNRRECIYSYRHNFEIRTSTFGYKNSIHMEDNFDKAISFKRNFEEYRDLVIPMNDGYLEMVNERFLLIYGKGFEVLMDELLSLSLFEGVNKINHAQNPCNVNVKFGKKEDLSNSRGIVYGNPVLMEEVDINSIRFKLDGDDIVNEVELNTSLMSVEEYINSIKK